MVIYINYSNKHFNNMELKEMMNSMIEEFNVIHFVNKNNK